MLGGWDRQDVAQAQRQLVLGELSRADTVGPFTAFLWAVETTGLERGTLLDVGCGCGHYGILCERHFPQIAYTGTDASAAMIAEAAGLAPLGKFRVCAFEGNDFDAFDIVLASQVTEMTPDPPALLNLLLSGARGYVILNRLRLTDEPSQHIREATYCGCVGHNWKWNEAELIRNVNRHAAIIGRMDWSNQTTLVLRAKHGECPI